MIFIADFLHFASSSTCQPLPLPAPTLGPYFGTGGTWRRETCLFRTSSRPRSYPFWLLAASPLRPSWFPVPRWLRATSDLPLVCRASRTDTSRTPPAFPAPQGSQFALLLRGEACELSGSRIPEHTEAVLPTGGGLGTVHMGVCVCCVWTRMLVPVRVPLRSFPACLCAAVQTFTEHWSGPAYCARHSAW